MKRFNKNVGWFLLVLFLGLAGFMVVTLARLNYNLACVEAANAGKNEPAVIMENYGFPNAGGSEPSDVVKIQALIISL